VDKSKLRAFLKDPLLKELENYYFELKAAEKTDRTANRTLPFKRPPIKIGAGKQSRI
jgi:hypothetical protein